MHARRSSVATLFASALLAFAPSALACGYHLAEVQVKQIPVAKAPLMTPSQLVASLGGAETALEKQQHEGSVSMVLELYPNIHAATPRQSPSVARALEVVATAIVRSEGRLQKGAFAERAPSDNLRWALATLHRVNEARPHDARAKSHLGEALAKAGDVRSARELLEDLASSDVVATAEAWGALATIRARSGDGSLAKDAERRCSAMKKGLAACSPGQGDAKAHEGRTASREPAPFDAPKTPTKYVSALAASQPVGEAKLAAHGG
jgi:hypothetical protein